jgi:hypothetical protein
MTTINVGDRVRVQGYEGGREGTIISIKNNNDVLLQMGTVTMVVGQDMVTVMSRSMTDKFGMPRVPKLELGDKVKRIYPKAQLSENDVEPPARYGEVTEIISEKRVRINWIGEDCENIERVSLLKWVPIIPAWFIQQTSLWSK